MAGDKGKNVVSEEIVLELFSQQKIATEALTAAMLANTVKMGELVELFVKHHESSKKPTWIAVGGLTIIAFLVTIIELIR